MIGQDGRQPLDGRWLARWIGVVTAAEAFGFVVPAIVGVVAAESSWFVPLLLVAGAAEGSLLGAGQAVVLRHRLVGLRRSSWVALTAAGAVVAYCAGLIPSTFADVWTQWGVPAQALLLTVVAVVLLLSIGTAQWVELRRHVPRAGWWILGTAVARGQKSELQANGLLPSSPSSLPPPRIPSRNKPTDPRQPPPHAAKKKDSPNPNPLPRRGRRGWRTRPTPKLLL